MTLRGLWHRIAKRVERFSYGADVLASHRITKGLTVVELGNPVGVHLRFGNESHHSGTLTREETAKLARLLARLSTTEPDGESQ